MQRALFHAAAAPRRGGLALPAHALTRPGAGERLAADQALPNLLLRATACFPIGLARVRATVCARVVAVGVRPRVILQTAQLFLDHGSPNSTDGGRRQLNAAGPPAFPGKRLRFSWTGAVVRRSAALWPRISYECPPFSRLFRLCPPGKRQIGVRAMRLSGANYGKLEESTGCGRTRGTRHSLGRHTSPAFFSAE